MQEVENQIIVNEAGALIPRRLFGQKDRILNELDQAGVFSQRPEQPRPAKPVRVEMPDFTREMRWIAQHHKEYAGQWVALDGDRLLSHGMNAREVFAAARQTGVASPFFAHLDAEEDLPFGGW